MQNKFVKILSSLVGIVFLVSGIGKSLAAREFSQILSQYGFEPLQYFAPVIIIIEIGLGLFLFFGIRQKLISLISVCFVGILSLGFLYGQLFANVSVCGCFGEFSALNTTPAFTYLRNVVLIGMLLYVFFKSDNSRKFTTDLNEIVIMVCVLTAASFVIGYTFAEPNVKTRYIEDNKPIEQSELGKMLNFSSDSTYFIFAFSYSCPHCFNSIENLKEYKRLGIADNVIGITFTMDEKLTHQFDSIFEPNFPIINIHPQKLFQLTNRFPTSYYVKGNRIKTEIHGVLPCGYLLQHELTNAMKAE